MLNIPAEAYQKLDPGLKEVIEISIRKEIEEKELKKIEVALNEWFEDFEQTIQRFSFTYEDYKIIVVLDDFLDKDYMRIKSEMLRKKIECVLPGIKIGMRNYRSFIEDQYMAS